MVVAQYVPGDRQAYPAGTQPEYMTDKSAVEKLTMPTLANELEVLGNRINDLYKLESNLAFQAARIGGPWPEDPGKGSEVAPAPDNLLDQLMMHNRSLHRLWNLLSDHTHYIANKLG